MTGPTPPTVDEGMREALEAALIWQGFKIGPDCAEMNLERADDKTCYVDVHGLVEAVVGPIASALAARERELDEARREARNYADMAEATGRMMQDRVMELLAENANLRASAERIEADHAEEIARLKAAIEAAATRFADIAAGQAFQPRSHAATGATEARAALTPKEPDHG